MPTNMSRMSSEALLTEALLTDALLTDALLTDALLTALTTSPFSVTKSAVDAELPLTDNVVLVAKSTGLDTSKDIVTNC